MKIYSETPILEDKTIFPDLPNGPLTIYRQRASFNYKTLALILEPEDSHRFKVNRSKARKTEIKALVILLKN